MLPQQVAATNTRQQAAEALLRCACGSVPKQAVAALCACTPSQAQCTHASMMQVQGRQLPRIAVARSVRMVGVWSDVWAQL